MAVRGKARQRPTRVHSRAHRWPQHLRKVTHESHRRHSIQSQAFRVLAESIESRTLLSTIIVNSTLDMPMPPVPMVTLRRAIALANAATSPTTITFSPSVFSTHKTITLTHGGLNLTNTSHATTITGPSVGVTVDGNNHSGVFDVHAHVNVTMSSLTVTKGTGFTDSEGLTSGGGIENKGTMTLTNVNVTKSTSTDGGGGIENDGTMTLSSSKITGDNADAGGGVSNEGTLTLSNDTISGVASDNGGGLASGNNGSVTITNTTISGGAAIGGGIWIESGTLKMTDSTVSNSDAEMVGGGIELTAGR